MNLATFIPGGKKKKREHRFRYEPNKFKVITVRETDYRQDPLSPRKRWTFRFVLSDFGLANQCDPHVNKTEYIHKPAVKYKTLNQ